MSQLTVREPDQKLMTIGRSVVEVAQAIAVDGQEMAAAAMTMAGEWKAAAKQLTAERKDALSEIKAVENRIKGIYDPSIAAFTQAEGLAKQAVLTWQQAEQRKLDEENRERERAAREEQDRIAAQARMGAEALKAVGLEEAAEVVQQIAVVEQAVVGEAAAPVRVEKVQGFSVQKFWVPAPDTTEEDALMAIAKAITQDGQRHLLAYLTLDMVAVRALATSLKDRFSLPGFHAEQKERAVNRA